MHKKINKVHKRTCTFVHALTSSGNTYIRHAGQPYFIYFIYFSNMGNINFI